MLRNRHGRCNAMYEPVKDCAQRCHVPHRLAGSHWPARTPWSREEELSRVANGEAVTENSASHKERGEEQGNEATTQKTKVTQSPTEGSVAFPTMRQLAKRSL
jgi:hypothetical protein